jgi:hypothetical protein
LPLLQLLLGIPQLFLLLLLLSFLLLLQLLLAVGILPLPLLLLLGIPLLFLFLLLLSFLLLLQLLLPVGILPLPLLLLLDILLLLRRLLPSLLPFDDRGLRRNRFRRGGVLLLPSTALLAFDDGRLRDRTRRGLRSGVDRRLLYSPHSPYVHDAHRSTRRRCSLANLLDVGRGEGATGISSQPRLLPLEWNRRWRRSRARHDRAAQHIGGRAGSSGCGVRPGTQNTFLLRSDRGSAEDLRRGELT